MSGTGPFIVTEREQGIRLKLERFDDYWDKASPGNVDEIIFTPIKRAGHAGRGASCRRCRLHRARAADRS
ncbi:MAG: ABC transporter substrate-binding protein [Hyphomicrobiales bacterium]